MTAAYTLTLAAFLLLGGALGDRYGRRRLFVVGVVWFGVASLACAASPSAAALVAARALQGVGAALLTPVSLAILQTSFVSAERSKAVGAWTGLGGLATAAGPVVGGYLVSAAGWRWVFVVNVPMALAAAALALRAVPESEDREGGRLDTAGAVLAVVWLAALAASVIRAPEVGWSAPGTLALLGAGLVALLAFLRVEATAARPMLPLHLFGRAQFTAVNAVTFAVYTALTGALFLLPAVLQVQAGYSALESGLAMLPVTTAMLVLSAPSGALAARIGPRLQMSLGPLVIAGGLVALGSAARPGDYLTTLAPAVVVFGLGLAITVAPLTWTALASVEERYAGLASAVNNGVARAAGLLAVAVVPSLVGLGPHSLTYGAGLAQGFREALLVGAGLCALGGALAAVTIRNPPSPATEGPTEFHCALDAPPPRGGQPSRAGSLGG